MPGLPDIAVLLAASGVAAGGAVLGQVALVKRVAERGYEAAAKAAEGGIPRFGLADWHILALRLSGDVRGAEDVARQVRRWTVDVLGPARLMGLVLIGQAELARGRVRTAERWLREAWAGLRDSSHEFRFRCRMHLTQALALQGDAAAARELLGDLEADRHPAYTLMEPEIELARAWVVASEGAISEAVVAAHAAADLAHGRSSAAYEVLALQTALGFGDHTVGGRLIELAGMVEGPRAPTAGDRLRRLRRARSFCAPRRLRIAGLRPRACRVAAWTGDPGLSARVRLDPRHPDVARACPTQLTAAAATCPPGRATEADWSRVIRWSTENRALPCTLLSFGTRYFASPE